MFEWRNIDPRNVNWPEVGEHIRAPFRDKHKFPLFILSVGCLALIFSCGLCCGVIGTNSPPAANLPVAAQIKPVSEGIEAKLERNLGLSATDASKLMFGNGPDYLTDDDLWKKDAIEFDQKVWKATRQPFEGIMFPACVGFVYSPTFRDANERLVVIQFPRDRHVRRRMFVQRQIGGRWKDHGTSQTWFDDGEMDIGNHANGEAEGECNVYFPTGKFHERLHYKSGKLHGLDERWWPNGQQEEKKEYSFGKTHGLNERWWPNGQKEVEAEYQFGEAHGLHMAWLSNGRKEFRFEFQSGKAHGLHEEWWPNGQKKETAKYVLGQEVSKTCWDDEGNRIQ